MILRRIFGSDNNAVDLGLSEIQLLRGAIKLTIAKEVITAK
jgi:hypothetical protein